MSEPGQPSPATGLLSDRTLTHVLGAGQVCSWGSLYYSFPLIAQSMQEELGWSKSELFGAATMGLIAAALVSYPIGVAIDRGHGKAVMGWASIASALMLIWWSHVDSLIPFYVVVTLIGGLQAAMLYEPAFAVLARRVGPLKARTGITTITFWGGFASTVFIPLIQWMLDSWNWRDALVALAAVNLGCAAVYFYLIRPGMDAIHAHHDQAKQANIERDRQIVRRALTNTTFWLLLIALVVYAAMFSAFTFHMYPLLQESGISTTEVVQAIAIIGPAQVAGRVVISIFASRAPMRVIGAVVVTTFPFTFAALLFDSITFWLVAIVFAVYGFANGIFTIVRSLVVPEMLSPHAYGALNGLLTIAATLARAAGPVAAAWLWSIDQSYHEVMVWIVMSAIVLMVTFFLAGIVSQRPGQKISD